MTAASPSQRGYSLIEVLVAFTILAMALTVLLRIFAGGLSNIDAASEYAQALRIGEAELAVPGVVEPMLPGVTRGESDGGYSWTRRVAEFRPDERPDYDDAELPPWHIAVQVRWAAGRGTRTIDLETIRIAAPGTIAGAVR